MCGFIGTVTAKTGSKLSHRGPDAVGAFSGAIPWANVSLEMTRLAIVDRKPINVPFDFRESCGVVLAFNGEVYNWRSLRAELSDGTPWQTDCDAEVVARVWRRWGAGMLDRMNGMWGLALVDEREGVVFLARDRAGEKPLYYAALGSGIAFASEIKALPIKLEEGPCAELETLEFDCLETTPFQGVRCLGPGEYMIFRSPGDLALQKTTKWWKLPILELCEDWGEAVEEVQETLVDAVKIRATCEVPVAVQLSGGLDSAIIQAIVRSERLYTVTFPEVDNLTLARPAAFGVAEPKAITFDYEDLLKALPKIAYHLDTPATWTAVCQWFMDKQIALDGAVVVLSGEGADELFGGYSRYRFLWWLERMKLRDANLAAYGPMGEKLFGGDDEMLAKMLNRGGSTTLGHAQELVKRFAMGKDLVEQAGRLDFYTTMQVLLRMADRMAAAFSLENRSPFLDYRLMELSVRMPTRWKVTESYSKAVLREVAEHLKVPRAIIYDKTKKGLFLPWSKWKGVAGERGVWDRSSFAKVMREAWREAFF